MVIVLGGGLKKEADDRWRTTNFGEEGDNFGEMGDRLRVLAAAELYRQDSQVIFVASGGRGQFENVPGAPAVGTVMKKELEDLGVPSDKIKEEIKSGSTREQLQELMKLISEAKPEEIKIVSSRWHLPRVKAMIENFAELNFLKNQTIELISAEDVLIHQDEKKWRPIIEKAYNSEGMKKRIEKEKQGAKDIESGQYKK